MRFEQLVNESTVDQSDLLNDVEELLTRAKARGYTKLNTQSVFNKIQSIGYSIDMQSLLRLLVGITSVGTANEKEITLDTALPDSPDNKKDAEVVSKLASKQIKKGVK